MPTPLFYLFTFSHNLEFRGLFVRQLEAMEFAPILRRFEDSIFTGRRYRIKHIACLLFTMTNGRRLFLTKPFGCLSG